MRASITTAEDSSCLPCVLLVQRGLRHAVTTYRVDQKVEERFVRVVLRTLLIIRPSSAPWSGEGSWGVERLSTTNFSAGASLEIFSHLKKTRKGQCFEPEMLCSWASLLRAGAVAEVRGVACNTFQLKPCCSEKPFGLPLEQRSFCPVVCL